MTLILSGTDGLSDVDGSAATPAIRGTDANTGIFFPAADTIAFSEGGAEAMRIDSSGRVGIGTSSPAAKLDVRGSSSFLINATNPTAWVSVDSALTTGAMYNQWNTTSNVGITGTYTNHAHTFVTNNTERMRIDSSGNVGIGTSSPTALRTVNLEVSSSGTNDSAALIVNKRGTGIATARLATVGGANGFDINYNFPNSGMLSFYDLAANTTRVAIDSSGNFQFNSGYGSVATAYGCRAWVNFNGTGTVAIRASGNVTSITDNGTGDYTVNFTTAMPDANYNAVSMGQRNDFNNGDMNISFYGNVYGTAIGTGSVRVNSAHASSYTLSDALTVCVAIFR